MSYMNQTAFDDPTNWLRAENASGDQSASLLSTTGPVLASPKVGGLLNPKKFVLVEGDELFRFAAKSTAGEQAIAGAWWLERAQFEKLLAFTNQHGIGIATAVRVLCLVPSEWSDMGKLMRVTVARPLLAMRGLGDNVSIDKGDGHGRVALGHANDNPARRLYQLFVPGLGEPGTAAQAFAHGKTYDLSVAAGLRGWLDP